MKIICYLCIANERTGGGKVTKAEQGVPRIAHVRTVFALGYGKQSIAYDTGRENED